MPRIHSKPALLGLAILAGYVLLQYLLLATVIPGWWTTVLMLPYAIALAAGYGLGVTAFWSVAILEGVLLWLVLYLVLERKYGS